ncbi:ATP-binding cassette domain-containing protein [Streptomyces griseoruber]|uniref:ABC transporter domain-containing protein n=1 Tax=Streptomyces griseoruber TaxID=1943 RepID=A0A101SUI7_9ACTN|nr:ATP-binding cassette domain-containing protein [Streptomyces griseoruber]KUN80198.1 hypothetical protein AQJ64_25890 [Streptomyces griseoruber]
MSEFALHCEELVRRHRSGFELGPLSLVLTPGVTCLVGPNGAGKSTFFRLAAGIEKPNSGKVFLKTADGPDQKTTLGYLPQDPELPKKATCEEFLQYVAWVHRVPAANRNAHITVALERTGLAERRKSRIGSLSGGMARRLGIAGALVHDPSVLFLDEPTVGLDPRQRIALRDTVSTISGGRIVIVSTHLVEDIRGLADRVIVLNSGSVVFDGGVAELEKSADSDAPGDTDLEKALATVMGEAE